MCTSPKPRKNAYTPYAPLLTPKPLAPDLWIVDGPEIVMNLGGLSVPFPTRMTIVRLQGGLWLHSPIAPDDALIERVEALGAVRWLIAPNSIHYWWIADWKARFREARVFAVPGLERKAKRDTPIDEILSARAPETWTDRFEQALIAGDAITECAFFHKASRTLILTDLIENFETERVRPWALRQLIKLAGMTAPNGQTPPDLQLSFFRQRKAVREAARKMLSWAPERIVLAHGAIIADNAQDALRHAFRWAL